MGQQYPYFQGDSGGSAPQTPQSSIGIALGHYLTLDHGVHAPPGEQPKTWIDGKSRNQECCSKTAIRCMLQSALASRPSSLAPAVFVCNSLTIAPYCVTDTKDTSIHCM